MANEFEAYRPQSASAARPASGQYQNQPGTGAVSGSGAAHTGGASSQGDSSAALSKGQILRGQVTNITAREITLQLDNGRSMTARYENGVELGIGDHARFRVLSSDSQGIFLKTFNEGEGAAQDTAAYKALEAASLPVSPRNVMLVSSLLQNGMPVHKQMIGAILQQSYRNPDISLQNLVTMNRYGLPIDPETTRWFENYSDMEHQLLPQMQQVTDELLAMADHLLASGDLGGAAALYGGVLSSFDGSRLDAAFPGGAADGSLASGAAAQAGIAALFPDASDRAALLRLFPDGVLTLGAAEAILNGSMSPEDLLSLIEDTFPAEKIQENALLRAAISAAMPEAGQNAAAQAGSEADLSAFLALLNAAFPEEAPYQPLGAGAAAANGEGSPARDTAAGAAAANGKGVSARDTAALLSRFSEALQAHPPAEKALALLSHPGLERLTKELIRSNWTLTPQEVLRKDSVSELYSRMYSQLSKMQESVSMAAAQGDLSGNLSGNLSDMQQNLNFMNTLNELYNYVQLPVRLSGQEAHGDLYVYGRKRSVTPADDGSVSCLLHLDLSRLGSMDIRIRMENHQVQAKFYLEDADSARLIESHLPELDEAVAAHGIQMKSELIRGRVRKNSQSEKDKAQDNPRFDFVHDFIEADNPAQGVRRYSFDIRA